KDISLEAGHLAWILEIGETRQPVPADGDLTETVRFAADADWGSMTVHRADSDDWLLLGFNRDYGYLQYWPSENGLVSGACFPNRRPVAEEVVELPCRGCEIPMVVPDRFVLRKADAVRLFLQYVRNGELPRTLLEPGSVWKQPLLPGLEEFIVPTETLNAVEWHLL